MGILKLLNKRKEYIEEMVENFENETCEALAKEFIKQHNYKKEDFMNVDINNSLEEDVAEFIENFESLLMDYSNSEYFYQNKIYEIVCKLLEID